MKKLLNRQAVHKDLGAIDCVPLKLMGLVRTNKIVHPFCRIVTQVASEKLEHISLLQNK